MNMEYQKGQILLIVVLVMVTVLTIGLSVVARTITNIRTSQEAANSEKAFSAAEAGIEQSLTNSQPVSGSFANDTTYETTVDTIAGVAFPLNNNSPVLKDEAHDIWLSEYPDYTNPWTGTMTLYWGETTDSCNPSEATNTMAALEVLVMSGSVASPQVSRFALDPCSPRSLGNRFEFISGGGGVIANITYPYQKTFTVTSGLFVRVIPLYASTLIAVRGCDASGANCQALPSQGTVIESVGTADNTQRKVITYRSYPRLPTELFPYSFFAPQ